MRWIKREPVIISHGCLLSSFFSMNGHETEFLRSFLTLILFFFLPLFDFGTSSRCEYLRYIYRYFILFGMRSFAMPMLLLILMLVSPWSSLLLLVSLKKKQTTENNDHIVYVLDLHVELTSIYMIQPTDQFGLQTRRKAKQSKNNWNNTENLVGINDCLSFTSCVIIIICEYFLSVIINRNRHSVFVFRFSSYVSNHACKNTLTRPQTQWANERRQKKKLSSDFVHIALSIIHQLIA